MVKELEDASGEKGPIIIKPNFNDKYWGDNKSFLEKHNLSMPYILFRNGIKFKEIDEDTYNKYIVDLGDLRGELAKKNQLRKSHNKDIRKKYYLDVDAVIAALKLVEIKQAGTGIRKYNQKKRNAYKISNNKYGG